MSARKKAVVEVYAYTRARLGDAASATGSSMKRMTSLLLDYALAKLQTGEIVLHEPSVEEVFTTEAIA